MLLEGQALGLWVMERIELDSSNLPVACGFTFRDGSHCERDSKTRQPAE
jgi:hypothetical protein